MESSDGARVSIIIADDHPVYRSGLKTLLSNIGCFHIVHEAKSGTEAVVMAQALRPELVLMDISMPGLSGIEATRALVAKYPEIAVIILTMLADKQTFLSAVQAGARGFLLKEASWEEVSLAIRIVGNGGLAFDSHSATWLIDHLTNPPADDNPFPELTERELDVLKLLADGHGNAAIARELMLSLKTVRNYISRIFAKLQVVDRTQAAVKARQAGLGH
jgi:DNA-binding NarL/FixJ family response regulator